MRETDARYVLKAPYSKVPITLYLMKHPSCSGPVWTRCIEEAKQFKTAAGARAFCDGMEVVKILPVS